MNFPLMPLFQGLTELVPFLTRWMGSPWEEKIVDVAQILTGEKDPLKVLQALKADPHLLIKFQETISRMDHEMKLAELKDRENARMRDMALAHAGRSNMRADIMVISAAFGLISCLITITLYRSSLPGEAVGIISTIAGIFGSCLKDAYAFEFGSSRGSKLKDSKLSALFFSK
jgi:hypothetical protein